MFEEEKHLTIREWSEEDRPREKMLKKGTMALSDAELLAILIGSGSKNESAVDLAKRVMAACQHNINELARLTIHELCEKFKGIGEAKAITIVAALEFGKRRKTKETVEKKKISSSADLFYLFEANMIDLNHEEFWVALLDGANKVIETRKLTQGGSSQTVVDIPMLLKLALEKKSACVAVAHNHPSGQKFPSREDEKVTQRVKVGCDAVGIRFLDHIIIAGGSYYSFCDEGKL
ncbi:MAG: DNA repair protein RadC [Paludibacter sp.]|nr:DNA repair protein RadC [Paludibacter sp.]MDD4198018.1 DNA repair protein RadC [Paludibacter sp.]MDD4428588.1 DNA repair protein RadC [Paludibacter sp.]